MKRDIFHHFSLAESAPFPFFSVSEVVNSYLCCTKIEFFFHRKGPTPEVLQEASVGISESAVVNCESCC